MPLLVFCCKQSYKENILTQHRTYYAPGFHKTHIYFLQWIYCHQRSTNRNSHCFALVQLELCTSIICCPLSFLSFRLGWNEYQMPLNTSGNLSHLFWSGYKGYQTVENQTEIKLLFKLLYKFKWSLTFWIESEKDIKIGFKEGKSEEKLTLNWNFCYRNRSFSLWNTPWAYVSQKSPADCYGAVRFASA